jgi:hypothetical protein
MTGFRGSSDHDGCRRTLRSAENSRVVCSRARVQTERGGWDEEGSGWDRALVDLLVATTDSKRLAVRADNGAA